MAKGEELIFELKGKRPTQLTLGRLSDYMREFGVLVGGKSDALFSEIREGSTQIKSRPAPGTSFSQAKKRVSQASRGEGSKDGRAAFNKICRMADEDGLPAKIRTESAIILHFPKPKHQKAPLKIRDQGHVTGELAGILKSGSQGVKVRLSPLDGGPLIYCTANNKIGDELAKNFYGCIRVFGRGWWSRAEDGGWTCESLEIEKAVRVENVSLKDAFEAIQEIDIDWADDPFDFESDVSSA